jgi:uncharacterized protein
MLTIAANAEVTNGIIGGVLIAGASTWLMYREEKIMGISGISATALAPVVQDKKGQNAHGFWSWSFLSGILTSGTIFVYAKPEVFGANTSPAALLSPIGAAIAGLLTGFGTRMGAGCTSGHGICGLPRRSVRSLTAVLTFITSGVASTYVMRVYRETLAPLFSSTGCSDIAGGISNASTVSDALRPLLYIFGGAFVASRLINSKNKSAVLKENPTAPQKVYNEPSIFTHLTSFGCGALFCLGLAVGGMTDPARVSGFLDITGPNGWDPTLMGVMGGGVLTNLLTFEYMRRKEHVQSCPTFNFDSHPKNTHINRDLVLGSALFGVGWGLSGVCPGPALASTPGAILQGLGNGSMTLYIPFMFLGMAIQKYI